MDDPIQAFLQAMGAGTPGNMMPGGGVYERQASTPGAPGLPTVQQGMGNPGWVNPSEFQGGAMPSILGGGGSPYWRALLAAAGVMQPTPTAANDQAPTDAWFQKPSGVGGMPGPSVPPLPSALASYDPLSSIQAPAAAPQTTVSPSAAQPTEPVKPTPKSAAPTKKRIDPASVDLGNSRFKPFSYQVPNSTRNAPIYTALNLGGSS